MKKRSGKNGVCTMKHSREMVEKALEALEDLDKDCFHMNLSFEKTSVTESKVGGYAYVPRGEKMPVGESGMLLLLCQLNLEEFAKVGDIFPLKTGILQFWNSDIARHYGANRENVRGQEDWRVLYYPTVEDCYTEEELQEMYPTLPGSGRTYENEEDALRNVAFPLNESSFKVSATLGKSPISVTDFNFDPAFMKVFNEMNPETPGLTYYALDLPVSDLGVFQSRSLFGHRLLGYPDFTKSDERTDDELKEYIMLMQLDSEVVYDEQGLELSFGDCGTAHWFIHPDDLEQGDFSKVMFAWDSLR